MNIRAAMTNLVALQAGLSITSPLALAVKKAWPYVPPQSVLLPDLPCWTNSWDLGREDRFVGMREQRYTVQMQLFVAEAGAGEQDRQADVATAFMDKLVDALDADVTLGQTVSEHWLRGASPSLAILERGGKSYIGLNLFLDLRLTEAKSFG